MGRMLTRVKFQLSQLRASRIAAAVVALVFCLLGYRLLFAPPPPASRSAHFRDFPHYARLDPSPAELQAKLRALQDTRPEGCRTVNYGYTDTSDVTVILTFHGEELYDLKLALESLFRHTPLDAFREVIVLDDGTQSQQVRAQLASFIQSRDGPARARVRVMRSEARDGEAASRFKAARTAQGSILVFAGAHVVFNTGWLQPLAAHLRAHPATIAVPHADNFLRGFQFIRLGSSLVNALTLTLDTVYLESPESPGEGAYVTPVMRGDVLAVTKQFYTQLGEYDETFKGGGGHDLELSLRTWLCGGEIKVLSCSRVAVQDALRPVPVTDPHNVRRLAELWLGDFRPAVYQQRDDVTPQLPAEEAQLIRARSHRLRGQLQCKSIEWYLSNIALDFILPSRPFLHFGAFRDQHGSCLSAPAEHSGRQLGVSECKVYMYRPDTLFEITAQMTLRTGNRCVVARQHDVIELEACNDVTERTQHWVYSADRQHLRHVGFEGRCLEKVGVGGELRVVLNPCSEGERPVSTQQWSLIKY